MAFRIKSLTACEITELLNSIQYDVSLVMQDLCITAQQIHDSETLEGCSCCDTIIRILEGIPYIRVLDHGSFSVVFKHCNCTDAVFKISNNLMDGWLHYASLSMEANANNESFLQVYGLEKYDGMYLACMEELKPLSDGFEYALGFLDEGVLSRAVHEIGWEWAGYANEPPVDEVKNSILEEYNFTEDFLNKHTQYIIAYLQSMNHLVFSRKCKEDYRSDNIMLRNNTLVLTDPVMSF